MYRKDIFPISKIYFFKSLHSYKYMLFSTIKISGVFCWLLFQYTYFLIILLLFNYRCLHFLPAPPHPMFQYISSTSKFVSQLFVASTSNSRKMLQVQQKVFLKNVKIHPQVYVTLLKNYLQHIKDHGSKNENSHFVPYYHHI